MSAPEDPVALPHMRASDILKIGDDTPKEYVEDLDAYFEPFVSETNSCINCGAAMDGFKQALGLAEAYQWGLRHGEANCSGCGWPARGMHYIKDRNGDDLLTIRNVFLPYHPDGVTSKGGAS